MIEVPLANGRGVARVDDDDADLVRGRGWYLHEVKGRRYARCSDGLMHRMLLGLRPRDGYEVDHVNGDGLDNRRENLRRVTHAQNQQNRHHQRGRTSRYRGVSWWKTRRKWTVRVKVDGVTHHGGHYDDEDTAGRVAAELRAKLMPWSTT
jgi:hypothetical protein